MTDQQRIEAITDKQEISEDWLRRLSGFIYYGRSETVQSQNLKLLEEHCHQINREDIYQKFNELVAHNDYMRQIQENTSSYMAEPEKRPREAQRRRLVPTSAADLQKMDLPPINWIIKGFMPSGLGSLNAPPKYYKSYYALGLSLAVCTGGMFLGHKCERHSVLYFDLESSKRRPQARMNQILRNKSAPKNLFFITDEDDYRQIGEGFEDDLEQLLSDLPDIGLVVIDTYSKISGAARRGENAYQADYRISKPLKQIADRHNISILLIHHTKKAAINADPFDNINGSNGFMGAQDFTWMLKKESRSSNEATLYVTGRDIEQGAFQISFSSETFQWTMLGAADDVAEQKRMDEFCKSDIVYVVEHLVDQNHGEYCGSASDIIKASQCWRDHIIADGSGSRAAIGKFINNNIDLFLGASNIEISNTRSSRERMYIFKKEVS